MAIAWKTVRVFICSTFRDMHAERDYLVRFVFPELRERCARRRVHLVDVDLRWGVTEAEAEKGKVLELCLDEIERCRPFFIALLGERYGWVPDAYDVPDEPRYDWVREFEPGHSITAMEIYHGVLNNALMQPRAFFYLRDASFLAEVPEHYRANFLPESEEAATRLNHLKLEIGRRGHVFENYPCRFSEVHEDGRVVLTGLETFGERVLEDLWSAIDQENPDEETASDELSVERAYHEGFIEGRSRRFVGRQELLAELTAYVDGEDNAPLVLTGSVGCGKSALLANFAASYAAAHPEVFVLPHFIGVSPRSTDIRRTLLRMVRELADRFQITEEVPADYHDLLTALPGILKQAGSRSKVVIILDGLNQLDESNNAHQVTWLPPALPANVKSVVSTLEGDCLNALRSRKPPPAEIAVGPLSEENRKEIVRQTLWDYRKRLDERPNNNQLGLLLDKGESDNPLYLVVACEELRIFGGFEQVTERIANLPGNVEGLFERVLERLEQDHGRDLVNTALSLLECSRYGLLESEMLELLARSEQEQLPPAIWARLYRSLQFYLRPAGESGEGLLDFFHRQISRAVRRRYLANAEAEVRMNAKLARYFRRKADPNNDGLWSSDYPRALGELPHHLLEGELYEELFVVARDETLLKEQRRAFADEPELYLRTIQAAIEGASRIDGAAAMSEFVVAHARRVAEANSESPLDAVRAGQLERAWRLADLFEIEGNILWYLLLAWELKDRGRILQARETLEQLQKKSLLRLIDWGGHYCAFLLNQVIDIHVEVVNDLRRQLLQDMDRVRLCGYLMNSDHPEDAFKAAQDIDDAKSRVSAIAEVATEQAGRGESAAARDSFAIAFSSAKLIEDAAQRGEVLGDLAIAQYESGQTELASKTIADALQAAQNVGPGFHSHEPLSSLAVAYAHAGSIQAALETAQSINGNEKRAETLCKIAVILARSGHMESAFQTVNLIGFRQLNRVRLWFRQVLARPKKEPPTYPKWRAEALREIAVIQKEADEAKVSRQTFYAAMRAAEHIEDATQRAEQLGMIANAQAEAGDAAAMRKSLRAALKAAKRYPDCRTYCKVAAAQSRVGEAKAAKQSIRAALRAAGRFKQTPTWVRDGDLKRIVATQVEMADFNGALQTAEIFNSKGERNEANWKILLARLQAGEVKTTQADLRVALMNAQNAADFQNRGRSMLLELAAAQAQTGDQVAARDTLRASLQTTRAIGLRFWKVEALREIATVQALAGEVQAARESFDDVLQTARRIDDREQQANTLRKITAAQSRAGLTEDAGQTTQHIEDVRIKELALCDIAVARLQAGDFDSAHLLLPAKDSLVATTRWRNVQTAGDVHTVLLSQIAKAKAQAEAQTGNIDAVLAMMELFASEKQQDEWQKDYWQRAFEKEGWNYEAFNHEDLRIELFRNVFEQQARAVGPGFALELFERIREPLTKIKALVHTAVDRAKAGETLLAQQIFDRALAASQSVHFEGMRAQALCEIAFAQAQAGDQRGAGNSFEAAVRTALEINHLNYLSAGQRSLRLAADDPRLRSAEEIGDLPVARLPAPNEWSKTTAFERISLAQAQVGDIANAFETAKHMGEPSTWNDSFISEMAISQARAGDFASALELTGVVYDREHTARTLCEIALAQARAGESADAPKTFDAALNAAHLIKEDSAWGNKYWRRDLSLRKIAVAHVEAGDVPGALRIAEGMDDKIAAFQEIATAQARAGDAASALQTLAKIDVAISKAEALCGLASEVRVDDIAIARQCLDESFQAAQRVDNASERAKTLYKVAAGYVAAGFGDQALSVADSVVALRNTQLPRIAAEFIKARDKDRFKRLLIPCAYYLDASFQVCELLARLFPEQSLAIANVVKDVA